MSLPPTRVSRRHFRRLVVLFLCLVGVHARPAAQESGSALAAIRARLVPGRIVSDLTASTDPGQRYAVYLPSAHDGEREWPVLFLLDPRGRALVPMEAFVAAAERRGWILVSSHNTASDTDEDVNSPAMRAMLADASRLFRLDARRGYLAGFSGTARAAWSFARALGGTAAGVIGFGGGLPGEPAGAFGGFAFYGGAGFVDFNYQEMRALDEQLDQASITHRIEFFPGGHDWGPPEACARAIDWMELQAMGDGRRPVDGELVERILTDRLAEAEAWESVPVAGTGAGEAGLDRRGPREYEAWLRYDAIVEDFTGLADEERLQPVRERASALAADPDVVGAREREVALATEESTARERLRGLVGAVSGETPPDLRDARGMLRLDEMTSRAEEVSDPAAALSARRILAGILVQVSFYLPRAELDRGQPRRALAYLAIADSIEPGSYGVLWLSARAHARLGDASRAVEMLRRAHTVSPLSARRLDAEADFDGIRRTPEYGAFRDAIEGS